MAVATTTTTTVQHQNKTQTFRTTQSHHHKRKRRRNTSEVSSCLKYLIFTFNVVLWFFGLLVLAVGLWAWTEKDTFNNLGKVANIYLDPAFVLICIGALTFLIGFTGCVGALRENTCLLGMYALILSILLLFEMSAGILGFIFKDWIKSQASTGFQTFIVHYRDDPDQQNLIDWIQEEWLHCCGVDGPKDWDYNQYFNCSSSDVGSREACGVPFSCCKRKPNEAIKNKQCGYDVRKPGFTGNRHIFERGCLRAGEEWIETNLVPVAAVNVAVMVLQNLNASLVINERGCLEAIEEWMERNMIPIATYIFVYFFFHILGICFAQNLRADIFAQISKWRH
ncbi:tetraspanin-5 isoform X3 [Harmonia axyridis]|uniref:tetraspanin-5 isoform X3 n=1 Tax=Harmonia axyridis TaxID=115357 RepID=UPI001E27859F|nr:tetraspanin-5 isoform X3 [Harmonia axyridis]